MRVLREALGGIRGNGTRRSRRIRRHDARLATRPDPDLAALEGPTQFGGLNRELPVDALLHGLFFQLKAGAMAFRSLEAQMRLLTHAVVGEQRVFGVGTLSFDPLFVRVALS
jgi:hypothetical protein